MRKFLISFILITFISLAGIAAHPSLIRIHCANDTTKIQSLINKGIESGKKTPGELMIFFGNELMGTPYVAHTLESEDPSKEYLTINIDELDCTTFMETCVALTKCALAGKHSWRDFANNIENIRYKNGEINGYGSRLHYISDWLIDNNARGNIKEVTTEFPRIKYVVKTLDFMSTHKDSYSALKDNEENLEAIKSREMGYRSHRYPCVQKTLLRDKNTRACFKNGDVVALLTKIDGLDATHVGLIKMIDGHPYLLHESMGTGDVALTDVEIGEYLRSSKNCLGVRVWRITE